jgi:hypothetical protein
MLRLGIEFRAGEARRRVALPSIIDERPVRLGFGGDVDLPLPADVLVYRKRGRLLVASASDEVPLALGACSLPTWFVPVPTPCVLSIGAVELAFFECVTRVTPSSGVARVKTPLPVATVPPLPPIAPDVTNTPPPSLDAAPLVRRKTTLLDRMREEWSEASRETKLACAAMLLTTMLLLVAR